MADFGEDEFDAEAHHVRYDDDREHFEEAEPEVLHDGGFHALGEVVLVPYVEHAEEQGRQQCDDHDGHGPFQVHGVADVRSFFVTVFGT